MTLHRYTTIERMMGILETERMALSDPQYWEDKNDSLAMEYFQSKMGFRSVYALCFTDATETIYHWGAFGNKNETCCLEIEADPVLERCAALEGYTFGKVEYIRLNELTEKVTRISQIPFVKRYPYRNEGEFRIVFGSKRRVRGPSLAVLRSEVRQVTINQHLPRALFDLVNEKIEREWRVPVHRSTVIHNDRWINHMKRLGTLPGTGN